MAQCKWAVAAAFEGERLLFPKSQIQQLVLILLPLPMTQYILPNMNIIWLIIIGLVAGFLAGTVVKGGGFGILGDLVVGVLGAILGGWLFGVLGITISGIPPLVVNLIVAFVGAVVLLLLLRLVGGGKKS